MYKKYRYLCSWVILFGSLVTVALGMSQENEDAPGPMVEDGPPAQDPVEDVAPVLPVPEDPEESQGRVDLEARSRIFTTTIYSSIFRSKKWCYML